MVSLQGHFGTLRRVDYQVREDEITGGDGSQALSWGVFILSDREPKRNLSQRGELGRIRIDQLCPERAYSVKTASTTS